MEHDEQTGEMTGMKVGEMTGAHDTTAGHPAEHGAERRDTTRSDTARSDTARRPPDHGPMQHGPAQMDSAAMTRMMELHMRMMTDSVIRRRMMADTAMRRMMRDMMQRMPSEHREHMMRMMRDTTDARPRSPARRPTEHRHPPTAQNRSNYITTRRGDTTARKR